MKNKLTFEQKSYVSSLDKKKHRKQQKIDFLIENITKIANIEVIYETVK